MRKISVGILGGAGYTGGELLRLLLYHPQVEIKFIHSRSHAGALVSEVHTDLLGDTELCFTDVLLKKVDVVFLCVAHGEAKKIMAENIFADTVRVIDLSQDFRIHTNEQFPFVYGLPEFNKELISKSKYIANPGCFATAIQLALIPLAANNLLPSTIHISATTGSTGAGQSLNETSHFSWRQDNLSVYKAFTHQHLAEIHQNIKHLQPAYSGRINMIPQRGSFTRGILACVTMTMNENTEGLYAMYDAYYATHPFVFTSRKNIDLKQVVNTNKCLLYLEKQDDQLMVVSIIDNLLKGAAGQAVQNMNLMFNLDETTGLKLKASAF